MQGSILVFVAMVKIIIYDPSLRRPHETEAARGCALTGHGARSLSAVVLERVLVKRASDLAERN